MEIGLTEEIRKMCGLPPLAAPAEDAAPLFCWDLARVDLGARKLLLAATVATRACAVTRMAAADWRRIGEVARDLAEGAVGCCGLAPSDYMQLAGGIVLTKTHGRRAMGCVLDAARALSADRVDMSEKLQWREMELLNRRLVSRCAIRDGYGVPAERFAEELAARLNK